MKKYLSMMSRETLLKCLGIIVLAGVSSFLASVWPVMLGDLYSGIADGSINGLARGLTMIAVFGLVYLAAECLTILRRVLLDCVIAGHEAQMRERSVGKLLKMPTAYYEGTLSGEKTAQLNQGVAGFSQLIKILCNDVLSTALVTVCTLAQVLFHAPGIMAVLMAAYIVLTFLVSVFQIRSQNGVRERILGQKNALDGQICQSINNLELIRSLHAEEYEVGRLRPYIQTISTTEKRHHRFMGSFDCLKQICKIGSQLLLLVVCVALTAQGRMPAGTVITVCLLFQQLIKPIDEVYRCMDETASSVIKASVLLEVFNAPNDEIFAIASGGRSGGVSSGDICLKDVIVTDPKKTKLLAWYEDITIPGGQKVAIQGANGCGKTSMIRCLNRYFPHTQGHITLFGRPQESYSQQELANTLYYTPQVSYFFAGTVRENLLYGLDRDVSDTELTDALRNVFLTGSGHGQSVLHADPAQALEYRISEKGGELSGGMKQRLSLARAFLRRPRLYVFDEITANLDENAAAAVLSNMEEHARRIGAGIVYISHDPKVVERCDTVIPLENRLRQARRGKAA